MLPDPKGIEQCYESRILSGLLLESPAQRALVVRFSSCLAALHLHSPSLYEGFLGRLRSVFFPRPP
ncbi:MAG: hypothetical protein PSN37_05290, partial [Alphaproteobacteria bacterium]|nr:hypothetical protein [Alphaproteobacteria bacterium]